jgi:hypothetical protein
MRAFHDDRWMIVQREVETYREDYNRTEIAGWTSSFIAAPLLRSLSNTSAQQAVLVFPWPADESQPPTNHIRGDAAR